MNMFSFVSNLFKLERVVQKQVINARHFHALPTSVASSGASVPSINNTWSFDLVRTIVRDNFPRPNERKRVKKLGWKARLKTTAGRRVIMNRILKGRWFLTH